MKSLISITLLGLLFVAGGACAQSQAPTFPCEEDERFAEFDFWVGEWDVHVANGTYAGSNSITSDYRRCVLIEDYKETVIIGTSPPRATWSAVTPTTPWFSEIRGSRIVDETWSPAGRNLGRPRLGM